MELKGEALEAELNSWSRLDSEWLSWNDRNGFKDEESLQEFGSTVSKESLIDNHQDKLQKL
jgi:hypothetical protein